MHRARYEGLPGICDYLLASFLDLLSARNLMSESAYTNVWLRVQSLRDGFHDRWQKDSGLEVSCQGLLLPQMCCVEFVQCVYRAGWGGRDENAVVGNNIGERAFMGLHSGKDENDAENMPSTGRVGTCRQARCAWCTKQFLRLIRNMYDASNYDIIVD